MNADEEKKTKTEPCTNYSEIQRLGDTQEHIKVTEKGLTLRQMENERHVASRCQEKKEPQEEGADQLS